MKKLFVVALGVGIGAAPTTGLAAPVADAAPDHSLHSDMSGSTTTISHQSSHQPGGLNRRSRLVRYRG